MTSKSRRQDHCSLQHFCSFLKLCSLSLLLLLIAFGDITRFEREREGDVQEVTLPNLGLGLAHDAGKWLLGQMSDIGCCLFICLQQGDPVKHWPTTAAP